MPGFLPGAIFVGILTALSAVLLRSRAQKPRLSVFKLSLIGVAGAYLIPPAAAFLVGTWHAQPWLPDLPVVTPGQFFLGAWTAFAILLISQRKGQPPRVPLWAGLLAGVATAVLFPPFIDWATGSYQNTSLRSDVNHCTRGMRGKVQPSEVTNTCDEPITVGLCMPGEINPAPCAQSHTIEPGETARFDPGEASLSSLPGNPGGLTVVACRPPDRPSRTVSVHGRGHEGVCIPPA
ncbi:MAG: hypothetical protein MEQ84_04020 [Mesorhizobium sp.]|nr:hypothetical protein [Mesorhizobium sp.]